MLVRVDLLELNLHLVGGGVVQLGRARPQYSHIDGAGITYAIAVSAQDVVTLGQASCGQRVEQQGVAPLVLGASVD